MNLDSILAPTVQDYPDVLHNRRQGNQHAALTKNAGDRSEKVTDRVFGRYRCSMDAVRENEPQDEGSKDGMEPASVGDEGNPKHGANINLSSSSTALLP